MKAQIYQIELHDPENEAQPAQFVLSEAGDDYVRGFIADINDGVAIFALWEPTDSIPDGAVVLLEEAPDDIIRALMKGAIARNPSMQAEWVALYANSG